MTQTRTFHYSFETDGFGPRDYAVELQSDRPNIPSSEDAPDWTQLKFHQCEGCQWKESEHCPVAVNLVEPATMLNEFASYDHMQVTVTIDERSYRKNADAQQGLMALFGLIMATSGCPSMEPMRALAWHHLPFASFEETLFRVVSAHLLKRYFTDNAAIERAKLHEEIKAIYEAIKQVNIGITNRLRASGQLEKDAAYNAIVQLDTYARLVEISLNEDLAELRELFEALPQ